MFYSRKPERRETKARESMFPPVTLNPSRRATNRLTLARPGRLHAVVGRLPLAPHADVVRVGRLVGREHNRVRLPRGDLQHADVARLCVGARMMSAKCKSKELGFRALCRPIYSRVCYFAILRCTLGGLSIRIYDPYRSRKENATTVKGARIRISPQHSIFLIASRCFC